MKISKDIFMSIIFMYPVVTYLMVLCRRYELYHSHSPCWLANRTTKASFIPTTGQETCGKQNTSISPLVTRGCQMQNQDHIAGHSLVWKEPDDSQQK